MKYFKYLFLLLLVIFLFFPFLFVLLGATNNSGWAYQLPIILRFGNQLKNNFDYLNNTYKIFYVIKNSIIVSLTTATTSILIIIPAAYAFAKYEFRFKKFLFSILISSIVIPQIAMLVGSLKLISKMNIYGTTIGLIIPFVINIRVFYYLLNIYNYVPNEIIDSAKIDGANDFQLLTYISLPIIKDKVLLSFFMLFVASWNNYLIPMIMMNSRKQFTFPVMLSSLADPLSYNTGSTFLALFIAILPIIVIFVFLSNRMFNEE